MNKTNVCPENIKYVIVRKFCGYHAESYDFVAQLAHEFAGCKEAVGYLPLRHAIHFDTKEEAARVLATQPEWVKNDHTIRAFTKIDTYCAVGT